MHTGFVISCYSHDGYVFSAPLSITTVEARNLLGRTHLISGQPLNEDEVKALRCFAGEVEIGWDKNLSFFLEAQNIPENDNEWM